MIASLKYVPTSEIAESDFSSVQFSRSVVSDSLHPHESQHARLPCPSPTPKVHSDSCPSSQWCHPAISSSVIPFSSCTQSLPASQSFPMNHLFAWGGQSTGILVYSSLGYIPWNGTAGLYDNSMLKLFRKHWTICHSKWFILHSTSSIYKVSLSRYPCQLLLFSAFLIIVILKGVKYTSLVPSKAVSIVWFFFLSTWVIFFIFFFFACLVIFGWKLYFR